MQLNEYQDIAKSTRAYPEEYKVNYPVLGLVGEAGELANKYKKIIRGADGDPKVVDKEMFIGELGDVMWYLANIATDIGVPLDIVAERNLQKLAKRKEEGKLGGSGDNR